MQAIYRVLFVVTAFMLMISARGQTSAQASQISCRGVTTTPVVLVALPSIVAGQTTVSVICLPIDNITIKVVNNRLVATVPAGNPIPVFVDGETPTGTIDGVNVTFALASIPSPSTSVIVYRNGIRQKLTVDYNLNGNGTTVVFLQAPIVGDSILVDYRR